jgi:hypothetical protein
MKSTSRDDVAQLTDLLRRHRVVALLVPVLARNIFAPPLAALVTGGA